MLNEGIINIVNDNLPHYLSVARKYVGEADSEDVVQELLEGLCKKTQEPKNKEAWLNTAIKNKSIDFKRRCGRYRRVNTEMPEIEVEVSVQDDSVDLIYVDQVIEKIYTKDLNVRGGGDVSRQIFIFLLFGLNNNEISIELGVSVGTVKSRKSRMLKRITIED